MAGRTCSCRHVTCWLQGIGDIEEVDGRPCLVCPWHYYKVGHMQQGTCLQVMPVCCLCCA